MQRELTITIDETTYEALNRQVGQNNINAVIEELVRSRIHRVYTDAELEAGYREMAADEEAEREALEWIEGLIGDSAP